MIKLTNVGTFQLFLLKLLYFILGILLATHPPPASALALELQAGVHHQLETHFLSGITGPGPPGGGAPAHALTQHGAPEHEDEEHAALTQLSRKLSQLS